MTRPCRCGCDYTDHGEETLWSNKLLTKTRPCCDCAECVDYEPAEEVEKRGIPA